MGSIFNDSANESQYSAQEQHRRAEREHWRMEKAVWRFQKVVNVIASLFSLFATLGAIVAAIYAGRAYHQAKRQAEAAEAQVGIMRDQEQSQLRAYVYVIPNTKLALADGAYPSVGLKVANGGETPAYNVRFNTTIAPLPYPLHPNDELPDFSKGHKIGNSAILFRELDATVTLKTDASLPDGATRLLREGDATRYYAYGQIAYDDILSTRHVLSFCYSFVSSSGEAQPCENRNYEKLEPHDTSSAP